MKNVRKNQDGIALTAVLLVILIVAVVGFGSYFILSQEKVVDKKSDTPTSNTIDSYEACIAAGNPVMESYPTQCAANGKVFTNPDQQPQQ